MWARSLVVLHGLVLLWAACLAPSNAMAQTARFQIDYAYAQASPAASDPADLARASFIPYQDELILAFPESATWIRLTIHTREGSPGTTGRPANDDLYTLKIGPNILERVDLFEPTAAGWIQRTDHGFQSKRPYRCLDERHCFRLDRIDAPVTTVYLRIESASVLRVHADILGSQELMGTTVDRIRYVSTLLAIGVCLLGISLYLLALDRSVLMLCFVLFQGSNILGVASLNGLLGQWFTAAPVDLAAAAHASIIARTLTILVLCLAFMLQHKASRSYKVMSSSLIAASVADLALVAAGQRQLALQINLAVWTALPLVQIVGALSAQDIKPTIRWTFVLFNLMVAMLTAIVLKGLFFPTEVDAYFPVMKTFSDLRFNGLWVSLALFALVFMERRHQAQLRRAAFAALQLQAQANRQAESQLAERTSLIDILTHELKNPLGTIRFAVESLSHMLASSQDGQQRVRSIQTSVTRMDDLIVHVAHANKIELLAPGRQAGSLAAEPVALRVIENLGLESRVACRIQASATLAADPQLVSVILENLLKNADSYGSAAEPIELAIFSQPDGLTCIEVSNPVDPDAMPDPQRVFTRYYRHTHAQVHPGMGIGLSLIRSTAIKLGGAVDYRPGKDRVCFVVRIPG